MIRRNAPPRRGVVLLAVLVVVALLALAAYQYNDLMLAEYRASDSYSRSLQARAAAESGIHYAAGMVSSTSALTAVNNNPYNNPTAFQDVQIGDQAENGRRMFFSLVAVNNPDDILNGNQAYRFGVADEGAKINLNSLMLIDPTGNAGLQILMQLPNMTEDVANSILDWIDTDDTTRDSGAENDYYSTLSPPYQCKNGPLDSLEELLLVKGVTPQLLFGNDRNRNGVLDPDEDDGTGQVDLGWAAYLTVYSHETNVDMNGNPRLFLNDNDVDTMTQNLATLTNQDIANFVRAARLYGLTKTGGGSGGSGGSGGAGGSGSSSGSGGSGGSMSMTTSTSTTTTSKASAQPAALSGADQSAVQSVLQATVGNSLGKGTNQISSIWSLVNGTVSIPVGSGMNQRTVILPSPLASQANQTQYLPLILDSTTLTLNADVPARVNVLTASEAVLTALPGIQTTDVQSIMSTRPDPATTTTAPDPSFQTAAWLLAQANLSATTLKGLEKYITSRTQVYRVQSLGYSDKGGPMARIEAVIDANNGRPRILYWRDLGELGKGFPDIGVSP